MRRSMHVRGLPAANGKELMLDAGEFVKRIERWRNFLRESMHKGMQFAGSWGVMLDLGKTVQSSKWGLRWCYETRTKGQMALSLLSGSPTEACAYEHVDGRDLAWRVELFERLSSWVGVLT